MRQQAIDLIAFHCEEEDLVPNEEIIGTHVDTLASCDSIFAFEGEALAGAISFSVVPHPYTGDLVMKKWGWFVYPEYRNGLGMKLLRMAEEQSKIKGAIVSFVMVPSKRKLPSSFIPFETTYVHIL